MKCPRNWRRRGSISWGADGKHLWSGRRRISSSTLRTVKIGQLKRLPRHDTGKVRRDDKRFSSSRALPMPSLPPAFSNHEHFVLNNAREISKKSLVPLVITCYCRFFNVVLHLIHFAGFSLQLKLSEKWWGAKSAAIPDGMDYKGCPPYSGMLKQISFNSRLLSNASVWVFCDFSHKISLQPKLRTMLFV